MKEEILDDGLNTVLGNEPVITKTKGTFKFLKMNVDEVADRFAVFMDKKGYKLEFGTKKDGRYGKGNQILRLLFGAFVKRFAWQVNISDEFGVTQLTFYKEAKGYAGGIIGVSQVNNEFNSIINSLKVFHASQEAQSQV